MAHGLQLFEEHFDVNPQGQLPLNKAIYESSAWGPVYVLYYDSFPLLIMSSTLLDRNLEDMHRRTDLCFHAQ